MRPVDLVKPFGPIKGEHDDIRLDVFQLLIIYFQLGKL